MFLVTTAPAAPCGKSTDPRILRTRQLLQGALEKLMETRGFDDLAVQDITDAATVNRATFYAHYPDKFALLECLVGSRFGELLDRRGIAFDGTCPSALKAIVLGVCDFLAGIGCPSRSGPRKIEPQMEIAIINVVRGMILRGFQAHPPGHAIPAELLASTVSWAIYGGAREWSQAPGTSSADEAAETVMSLAASMLRPANSLDRQPRIDRPGQDDVLAGSGPASGLSISAPRSR
jgi:AcrR family transcriptional regulator